MMAKQAKTKRREKYKSKAMRRVVKNMNGAKLILQLCSRAECNSVSSVAATDVAVDYMQMKFGTF